MHPGKTYHRRLKYCGKLRNANIGEFQGKEEEERRILMALSEAERGGGGGGGGGKKGNPVEILHGFKSCGKIRVVSVAVREALKKKMRRRRY